MNRYIIADEAIQDLQDISDYFLRNNLEAGEQFLQAFNARYFQLVKFPKLGIFVQIYLDYLCAVLSSYIRLVTTMKRLGLKSYELLMGEEISKIYLILEDLGK